MKLKLAVLALTSLLMGSLAGAATPASPGTPGDSMDIASFMLPTETPPDCAEAVPSFLNPAPSERAGVQCGSCSSPGCQGQLSGTSCGYNAGVIYKCYVVQRCSEGAWDCLCSSGPV